MPSITLTGVDDATDLDAILSAASSHQPGLVEWGVLYSTSNAGRPRYPSRSTIDKIARLCEGVPTAPFALHICGRSVADFIASREHVSEIARAFPRVQINFAAPKHDLVALRRLIEVNPRRAFITQRNTANFNLWPAFADLPNHAYLFDASGGRGVQRMAWPAAMLNARCGWSGGLGPDNLEAQLPRIHAAARLPYWIDMESGLRDEADQLDLGRACRCIEIVEAFNRAHP
jgi:phosphoribosylanthranilate isomerase